MATLIQQLIQLLDENISPSVVFSHPDIESLGRHLAEKYRDKIDRIHVVATAAAGASDAVASARAKARPAPATSDLEAWFVSREAATGGLIVPMQTNASGTPVFAVPGVDGSPLSLQTLGRAMEGVRPMFAFQAVGLDGTRGPLESVSEIADANIAALTAMRDNRRLSLLGHSNGAIVAFEMARKLLKKNVAIERLVLVDCRCPASSTRNLADEISEAFVNLIKALGGDQPMDVAEFRQVPEDERADYLYELVRRNGFETPKQHFMLAYRLSLANEKACRTYRPQRLPKACETVVVRATQGNGGAAADLGWNKFLVKPAIGVEIDADHLSVVGAAGSAAIAKIFQ
jgi:thioesterase domain-containing protein